MMIQQSNRIHAFDALRAIMMLLGIVLHASESYNLGSNDLWPKDPRDTNLSMNYINSLIHVFRMPIFFVVAGFFGALLFYERSPKAMLENRIKRIVLPFVVFLMLLHPIILSAINFTTGSFGVTLTGISTEFTVFPQVTYHLWFLYYLVLFSLIAYTLARILEPFRGLRNTIGNVFEWLMARRLLFIFLLFLTTFLLLVWMWDTWIPTPLSFIPDIKTVLSFGLFYFFGWLLFVKRQLLESLMRHDKIYVLAGFLIFTGKFIWYEEIGDVLFGTMNALVVWLFVFGIMGMFIRYANTDSKRMRYVSDSSYWIYLIHLPLTIFIPGLIMQWDITVFGKFLVVMLATSVICVTSYHILVRGSFVGWFLNGKRY